MTPQERELIDGLYQRLKAADTPQKDREADDLIAKRTVEQPGAPYLLVQTVLVQDHALGAAQQRIAQLEKELADAHTAQAQPGQASGAAGGGASFLGGLLGGRWNQGGTGAAAATPHSSVPITAPAGPGAGPAQAAPPYAAAGAAPYAAAPASGGFLHSALTTAAGVAAGGLLYNGLSSLLFHRPGPFGPYIGTGWGGGGFGGMGGGFGGSPWGGGGNVYETVNNYGTGGNPPDQNAIDTSANDPGTNDPGYDPSANDPNVQNVDYDPSDSGNSDDSSSSFDDNSGGDFGGGSDDMSV